MDLKYFLFLSGTFSQVVVQGYGYGYGNSTPFTRLFDDLFMTYMADAHPAQDGIVNVTLGLNIYNIVGLDEKLERLTINALLNQKWTDTRLKWNSSNYNGIDHIRIAMDRLWLPDITLYNSVDELYIIHEGKVMLYQDGTIFSINAVRLNGKCSVDLYKFPFDTQICKYEFGSWTHSGESINLQLMNGDVDKNKSSTKGWNIINMTSVRRVKYYTCCPNPFPSVIFTLQLQRSPVYYVHTYILPAVLLSILVPFQLILPPDSKERLTLGTGIVIGNMLMILRLQDVLPTQQFTLPALGVYYSLNIVWSVLAIMVTITVLNIHNRGPRQGRVPETIRLICLRGLKRVVCLGDDSYYPFDQPDCVSMRGLDNPCIPSSPGDSHKAKDCTNAAGKLEDEVENIGKRLSLLTRRFYLQDSRNDNLQEWYQLAMVIDRIFSFLFVVTFLIYTLVLLA